MAFMAMVFGTVFLIVVVIGLGILLLGIILDIVWGIIKHKDKKVPIVLKVFALIFTIWGVLQGVGPIAFIGVMSLKKNMEYRAEISGLPDSSIIHVKDDYDLTEGFDLNGIHYVPSYTEHRVITPQESREEYKTEKVGAIVYENGKHYVLNKVKNELDANVIEMGVVYDPYIEESKVNEINEYYKNKAEFFCEVHYDGSKDIKRIDKIDSARIRDILEYAEAEGSPYAPYDQEVNYSDGFMIFYTYDAMYCVDFFYKETDEGLCISYKGDYVYLKSDDADYIRSLIKE